MKTLLILASAFLFSSCDNIRSYTVDGTGIDWAANPIQEVSPDKVKANISINLPEGYGSLDLDGIAVSPEK